MNRPSSWAHDPLERHAIGRDDVDGDAARPERGRHLESDEARADDDGMVADPARGDDGAAVGEGAQVVHAAGVGAGNGQPHGVGTGRNQERAERPALPPPSTTLRLAASMTETREPSISSMRCSRENSGDRSGIQSSCASPAR